MTIQQLLEDPNICTRLLKYAESHSEVVRRGYDPGDVLEHAIKILNRKAQDPTTPDILKPNGYFQMVVGLAVQDTRRDFIRDPYNNSARWDTFHPATWSTEDIPVSNDIVGEKVRAAMSQLTGRQQRVLELHAEGWSYSQIATELGVKERGIRFMVQRAKQNMKKSLETTLPAYGRRLLG